MEGVRDAGDVTPVPAPARRRLREVAASVVCFAVLVGALAVTDPRVGERLSSVAATTEAAQSASWRDTLSSVADALFVAARDQTLEHAPLVVLTMAAVVFLLLMIRI